MLVFRSISRNDREILGNHAENPGPEGRRVFPLRFFPKLVDHPLVLTLPLVSTRSIRPTPYALATWHSQVRIGSFL
jgi:hypothetical protein